MEFDFDNLLAPETAFCIKCNTKYLSNNLFLDKNCFDEMIHMKYK